MITVVAVILIATTYHCYYGYYCPLSSLITFIELTYTCTVCICIYYIYMYKYIYIYCWIGSQQLARAPTFPKDKEPKWTERDPWSKQPVAHRSESRSSFSMAAPHAHHSHTGHPSPTQKESRAATSCSSHICSPAGSSMLTQLIVIIQKNIPTCKIGCKITIYIYVCVYRT